MYHPLLLAVVLILHPSAIDCLDRLVSEMACYVCNGTLKTLHTHSFTTC